MGSSSLIYHAIKNDTNKKNIIYQIDLSTISAPKELFVSIAKGLLKASKIKYDFTSNRTTDWNDLLAEIKFLFEDFNNSGIRAVCIIDEFDKIKDLFGNETHYFQSLRNIAYDVTHRISLITISRRGIEQIESQAGGISNFYQVFADIIFLKPYNTEEQNEYFSLFNRNNIFINEKEKKKIIDYSGACPYLLNILCYEIFEYYQENKLIDIKKTFEYVEDKYFRYYKNIIKQYIDEERYELLSNIINNELEKISKYKIRDFEKTGLIVKQGKNYRLFSKYIHKLFEDETERSNDSEKYILKDLLNKISEWLGNSNGYADLVNDKNFEKHISQSNKIIELINNDFQDVKVFNKEKELLEDFIEKKDDILIKKISEDIPEIKKIAISQIKIRNYYDIKSIDIKNIPLNTKWIFLTGENGFGKTLILQAITAALFGQKGGDKHSADLIKSDSFNVAVEIVTKDGVKLQNFKNPFFTSFNSFVAYGPYRLKIRDADLGHEETGTSSRTYSIFNNYCELLSIERGMLDLQTAIYENKQGIINEEGAEEKLEDIKNIFKKLLHPHISDIVTQNSEVKYIENGSERKFHELASGMKSIIAMIGDMLIRLFKENNDVYRVKDLNGIVIIDEIELYLHVKLQRRISNILSDIFPNILFIASTHSPIPILGAPKESIILKVKRKAEDNKSTINVEKFVGDFKRLLPNALLTSDIFDFEEILPEYTDLKDVSTADNYKEYLLRKLLNERLGIVDEELENEEVQK